LKHRVIRLKIKIDDSTLTAKEDFGLAAGIVCWGISLSLFLLFDSLYLLSDEIWFDFWARRFDDEETYLSVYVSEDE